MNTGKWGVMAVCRAKKGQSADLNDALYQRNVQDIEEMERLGNGEVGQWRGWEKVGECGGSSNAGPGLIFVFALYSLKNMTS
jgi:hypothetical protein